MARARPADALPLPPLAALLGLTLAALAGCIDRGSTAPGGGVTPNAPGPEARKPDLHLLRQDPTEQTCRAVLQQLNAQGAGSRRTPPLTPEQAAALAEQFRLSPGERDELARPEYTRLDAHYLAECLMFAEAAKSMDLDLPAYPERDRAEQAFAWVVRNVYQTARTFPAAPATYVALRGSGDGLERSYVFLALLQQLGLDGCLVGPPSARDRPSFEPERLRGEKPRPQPSPFWAVGARVGQDVLLFEPVSGVPWPAPGGKGTATLADLRAGPEAFEGFLAATPALSGVKPEELRRAAVFLSPPLSAMAPRMGRLEEELSEVLTVRLRVDPEGLRKRFGEAAGGKEGEVLVWAPPDDPGTRARALGLFLPYESGGLDRTGESQLKRFDVFRQALVPWEAFPAIFREVGGVVGARVGEQFIQPFIRFVLDPGSPHDLAVRGRLGEAVQQLTQQRDRLTNLSTAAAREPGLEKGAAEWSARARSAFADLSRAERAGDVKAMREAESRVKLLMFAWEAASGQEIPPPASKEEAAARQLSLKARLLLERSMAEQLGLRATFLLAVCMQERAERLQARLDRPGKGVKPPAREDVLDAWKNAQDWWEQYLRQFAALHDDHPDRAAHARRMAERVSRFARGE
ncbi:MAG TPA: hypothetical protein VIL46_10495 [Gemmataceae bacterium]